jgi:cytochrome P450
MASAAKTRYSALMPAELPRSRSGLRLLLEVRRDPLVYFTQIMRDEGAYAWFRLRGAPFLMMNDAAGIQHVLRDNATNYRKTKAAQVLRPVLGNGIILSEGDTWRQQRREAAPAFAGGNFDEIVATIGVISETMFSRWERQAEAGQAVDLRQEFAQFALEVLLQTLFHAERGGIAEQMQPALAMLLRQAEARIWSPFRVPQALILRLPKYARAITFLRETVTELIETRRRQLSGGGFAHSDDLLSRLVLSHGYLAQEQSDLRDQVMTFLLAGHETTAHALTWSFYCLARHPDEQRKLQCEADEVLRSAMPRLDDVRRLRYANQALKEALRLYPPAWTLSREAIADDAIPLDDGSTIAVPKGSAIMLCEYAVHRRECYWSDPEAFYPDRFSPENSATRREFAWFPFGGGPRLCLGLRFAEIEATIALAMAARRFHFTLLAGQRIEPMPIITLRPGGPVHMRFDRRSAVSVAAIAPAPSSPSQARSMA